MRRILCILLICLLLPVGALAEARRGDRLSLLMQTICATGIRVSELHSITAAAVEEKASRILFIPKVITDVMEIIRMEGSPTW